jgi:hypothetical protein
MVNDESLRVFQQIAANAAKKGHHIPLNMVNQTTVDTTCARCGGRVIVGGDPRHRGRIGAVVNECAGRCEPRAADRSRFNRMSEPRFH